jgi:hypothetical protein
MNKRKIQQDQQQELQRQKQNQRVIKKPRIDEQQRQKQRLNGQCEDKIIPKTVGETWSLKRFFFNVSSSSSTCHYIFISNSKRDTNVDGHLIIKNGEYYPHTTVRYTDNSNKQQKKIYECRYGYNPKTEKLDHWGTLLISNKKSKTDCNPKLRRVAFNTYKNFYNYLCLSGWFHGKYYVNQQKPTQSCK